MGMVVSAYPDRPASVQKIRAAWTSAADGSASASTPDLVNGKVVALRTVPGVDTEQPSDNYDVTVLDRDSSDVLAGAGLNRSNAAAQLVASSSLGAVAESALLVQVANAGNAKSGLIEFWVQDFPPG